MVKLELFINKSNKIHNNKYDYSLVDYINSQTKVKIICPEHGVFEQLPNNHTSKKYGCPICSKRQKKNNLIFICDAKIIHNNKYDYSLVDYKDSNTKVKIICPEHGVFIQTPNTHLNRKYGCPVCSKNKKMTTELFIERSNKIHNNKYDYSLVDYKNAHTKVKIICPIHGIFEQEPNSHKKSGCGKCANIIKRLKRIEEISINKFDGYQTIPSFNRKACHLFDNIMKEQNIYIQHAMNGGEYYIKELGYWLDGYDKENNIVYEFDERQHFTYGKLKQKDIDRQEEIENFLKCKFIRIKKTT